MLRTLMVATLAAGTIATGALGAATSASAQAGVEAGELRCRVSGGLGLIVGSRKSLECTYSGVSGVTEVYDGTITKLGIDIGETQEGELVWGVLAPASSVEPGALAGKYYGVSADVTAGVGVGANVLVGGFDRSISLQPVSVQGQVGANIAAGVAEMSLEAR
ncbi:DUF992 domain-containing protein [Acuticoccus sp. M5D2P5]|uniref:DUF992 domain-containing protein n=1 Tax=Acuticoccus kalidii TaxID=2910977 RepID=UPI001F480095|nr:DUF992 domain-containing protein [Acuticoccus kalidii]MCF3935231.1 DUF992 domain-containing protein [Acuticoccus kalidii]